jgi:hypothetical protein
MASTAALTISPASGSSDRSAPHPVADQRAMEPVLRVGLLVVAGAAVTVDRVRVLLHRGPQRLGVDPFREVDQPGFDARELLGPFLGVRVGQH